METSIEISELYNTRSTFIENLSGEFVAMTGHGVYVYLSPVEIDQLFSSFLNHSMPIRTIARQCIKNVLGGV